MKQTLEKLRNQMQKLDLSSKPSYCQYAHKYFDYYNLNCGHENVQHYFGTFKSDQFDLAAHLYKPSQYKAVVILVHGYLGHSMTMAKLADFLLEHGYAVAIFDLPGHGLSSGRPCAINNFASYSKALEDFQIFLSQSLKGPFHVVGFSTGASTVIDSHLRNKNTSYDKVILVAPLIKFYNYRLGKFASKLTWFMDEYPRIFRKQTHDQAFMDFIKHGDPLQVQKVPACWIKALFAWNRQIQKFPPSDKPVKILQGRLDGTVQPKRNIPILKKKFTNLQVSWIDSGRHELLNEKTPIRLQAFNRILYWLQTDSEE